MIPKLMVWDMENLSISLDRTRRVVLETGMERVECVSRRIDIGIT
jgi:hypothetical protein